MRELEIEREIYARFMRVLCEILCEIYASFLRLCSEICKVLQSFAKFCKVLRFVNYSAFSLMKKQNRKLQKTSENLLKLQKTFLRFPYRSGRTIVVHKNLNPRIVVHCHGRCRRRTIIIEAGKKSS